MSEPDRLYIEKVDRHLYETLESERFIGKRSDRELFLFAMAYGVKNGHRQPIRTREGYFLAKDLRDEDRAIMRAVVISNGPGQEALLDEGQVFQVAEEYAHAGVTLLAAAINGTVFGTFEKSFEKDLADLFQQSVAESKPADGMNESE
jgi:hypothetical protein